MEERDAGGPGLLVQAVHALPGVTDARLDPRHGLEVVGEVDDQAVRRAVEAVGYRLADAEQGVGGSRTQRRRTGEIRRRAMVAAGTGLLALMLPPGTWPAAGGLEQWLAIGGVVGLLGVGGWCGGALWRRALAQARRTRPGFEQLVALVLVTAGVEAMLSQVAPDLLPTAFRGGYLGFALLTIAAAVGGQLLQTRAGGVARRAIRSLRALRPLHVVRVSPGARREVIHAGRIRTGDRLLVGSTEPVPVDGRVADGAALVDESLLTGDASPVQRRVGERVIGGSINRGRDFVMIVTRTGRDTTLARLIGAVREAQRNKPGIDRTVDDVSGGVLLLVLLTAAAAGTAAVAGGQSPGHLAAVVMGPLLLACPLALGLATPLAMSLGVSRAAEYGAVTRRGDALQAADGLTTLVVDKTGTVTTGVPDVVAVEPSGEVTVRELFGLAASLAAAGGDERYPAVVRLARERGGALSRVADLHTLDGGGLAGTIEERAVCLAEADTLAGETIDNPLAERVEELQDEGALPLLLTIDGRVEGVIALADAPRDEAHDAVARLQRLGLRVVMLTGDEARAARAMARRVGIEDVFAGVDPAAKALCIRELQARGERVGMVGNGANDAAALAQADVGFGVAAGTEVALQSADIGIVRESLHAVADALELARATVANIRQNIAMAFAFHAAMLPVAAGAFAGSFGWLLTPPLLLVTTVLATATVVANANRLRFYEVDRAV